MPRTGTSTRLITEKPSRQVIRTLLVAYDSAVKRIYGKTGLPVPGDPRSTIFSGLCLVWAQAMRRHSLLLAILALSGCSAGNKTPSSPTPLPQPNSTINYTALGASDAQAIGSSVECLIPFVDCPNGMGYVQVATRQLKANGYTVNLTNLGIATATVGRDFQDLGNQNGHLVVANFIEGEAPVVNSTATLITIFGGANDVNVVTGAMGKGVGAGDQIGYID